MKIVRLFTFILFACTLYLCVDCLLDVSRAVEHDGAFIGMFISVVGCVLALINPYTYDHLTK